MIYLKYNFVLDTRASMAEPIPDTLAPGQIELEETTKDHPEKEKKRTVDISILVSMNSFLLLLLVLQRFRSPLR